MFKIITIPNCFIAIVIRCLFIYKHFKNICKKVLFIQILVVYLYQQ